MSNLKISEGALPSIRIAPVPPTVPPRRRDLSLAACAVVCDGLGGVLLVRRGDDGCRELPLANPCRDGIYQQFAVCLHTFASARNAQPD